MAKMPLSKQAVKERIEAAKGGSAVNLKGMAAVAKKAGLKIPTSLDEMTPQQRQLAGQTLKRLMAGTISA